MPRIKFAKNKPEIEVPFGVNLMQALLAAGLPVASSCNGEGVCAKCRIKILEGTENLSPPNDIELILKEQNQIGKDQRISCQTLIQGPIKIDTSYW